MTDDEQETAPEYCAECGDELKGVELYDGICDRCAKNFGLGGPWGDEDVEDDGH